MPDFTTAQAARGLTEFEAETAFALSLVKEGAFSHQVITQTKAQMIRKSGLMEFWPPVAIEDVGGLQSLKGYIGNRKRAFEPGNDHLPRPKGILLVGIPGTGKSLSCKATASILGWPLIRLDIGALKNSLVGESERRMRQATRVIDAFGEAVIWLDEVEKAFAGTHSSGQTDAGTTASMFGHFLTWMQETKAPVLVMATANNIAQLPPEFLRAGRFDAIFFVDLPTVAERGEILDIMRHRYATELPIPASDLSGYTGAEIEQLAKDSIFDGTDTAMENIVPLSRDHARGDQRAPRLGQDPRAPRQHPGAAAPRTEESQDLLTRCPQVISFPSIGCEVGARPERHHLTAHTTSERRNHEATSFHSQKGHVARVVLSGQHTKIRNVLFRLRIWHVAGSLSLQPATQSHNSAP